MALDSITLDYLKIAKEIYDGKHHFDLLEKSKKLDQSDFLHKIYKTPEYNQWMDFVGAVHDQNWISYYTKQSISRPLSKIEKKHMRSLEKIKEERKKVIEEMLKENNLLN
jgi:hypothetical protein